MKTLFTRYLFPFITLLALFFSISGVAPVSAARSQADPSGWIAMGAGLNGNVNAIVVNGTDIYAGGAFTNAGGNPNADYIAKWNGTAWLPVGAGLNGPVNAIAINGTDVYVGGSFTSAGSVPKTAYIAKWNGTTWSALGTGLNNKVNALAVIGTNVYVGGWFVNAGGNPYADYIAKWNGGWLAMGTGVNNKVNAFTVNGSDLYVGGEFSAANGLPNTSLIAKWNGTKWSALGLSNSGLATSVYAIAVNGANTYIGGPSIETFDDPGYTQPMYKFNGSTWAPLNVRITSFTGIYTMTTDGTNIYAGGNFYYLEGADNKYIAKWNGAAWSPVAATALNAAANVIVVSGTNLIVGGAFTKIGENTTLSHIAMISTIKQPVAMVAPSIAAQDGVVAESFENSNVGGVFDNASGTILLGDMMEKKQYRSILSFNTSSIPDTATITGVILKVKGPGIQDYESIVTTFLGFMFDIKNGFFANLPALQIYDFQAVATQTLGPIRTIPVAGVYSFDLTAGKAAINKLATNGGLTQIRLRFKLDDDNDQVADYMSLYSSNDPTAANRPKLVITYLP